MSIPTKIRVAFVILYLGLINTGYSQKYKIDNQNNKMEYLIRKPHSLVKKAPMLVLLHGYGSNEHDLFSLTSHIPEDWLVVSIRGTFAVGQNQYCWFKVQMVDGKISIDAAEEENSRYAVLEIIDKIVKLHHIDSERIVVAGFSQGANLSESIALLNPDKIAGFAMFSGRFMEEIKSKITSKESIKNLKVFVAHGTNDKMLPKHYADENIEILMQLGLKPKIVFDNHEHTISYKALKEFSNWLIKL